MKIDRLRNIGIAAHIDAGKTTLSERILVATGKEHRVGRVDEGTAVLDWMEEERERGITIASAATCVPWKDVLIQLIDTPGHVDFTIEVERCMRVLDGGVLVLDAIEAVQAQTDTVWRQMARRGLPVLAFVNKCERSGADFLGVAAKVRARLGIRAVAVQYPVEEEGRLVGMADLLGRTMAVREGQGERVGMALPEHVREEVEVLRVELVEALAEEEVELLEDVVAGREPEVERLHAALRRAVLARRLLPLFGGSALQGLGVAALLDGIQRYLPSPLDRGVVRGVDPNDASRSLEREPSESAPLAALAFKLMADEHGDSTLVRVYSGCVEEGGHVYNPRTQKGYRVHEIRRMHADHFERLSQAGPGDIVALRGPHGIASGDTLCAKDAPIVLESLEVPEPVIARVLEPQNAEERDRLRLALARLTHEDLALRTRELESSGQFVLEGMGSLHLEIQLDRLKRRYRLEPRVGAPQVSYRECLTGRSDGQADVRLVVGGKEIVGRVRLRLSGGGQGPPRVGFATGVAAHPEIEEVLLAGLATGPLLGYPLLGALVEVLEAHTEGTEGVQALVPAARKALESALEACPAGYLEPLVELEVTVPEEFRGGILADLGARGAEIELVQSDFGHCLIRGAVPLAEVFDYSTEVRSLSQGRATFSMHPAGHRAVAAEVLGARGLVL
ncbi:MAG: GTP-binding protein [Planctomycetes bacterium]|nr:GTP-binding protein [Planctomycetota bacterium]MCB9910361.1 GTP-binding protein [Planctomycetota bacterium]MCB9912028.1 GTP-binding protein [Planctomycetota bacterium]HRV80624.1 GTP-binding protein [Planctomycetota bacterium]